VKPALHVQAARAELGLGEMELAGHTTHVSASVAPTVVEYVPAEQSLQDTLPVAILYLPATQAVHAPPSGPVKPALHVQAARAELGLGELALSGHVTQVAAAVAPVVVEYVPAAQSVHTALPVAILYLPATQEVHTPPSGPVDPALHVQAVRAELGLGEMELIGHATQVAASVAPTVVEYVPAAQSVQAALPVAILYLTATQAVHVPPLGPVNPTLHVQAARVELGLGELELAGHATQVAAAVAATVVEYVPAAQSVHAAEPVAIL
jgi:hypothetical protein